MAAMYYQGSSEIQADGLQTLYLMNPNYLPYSDTQNHPQPNTPFFNPLHAPISAMDPHAPPSQPFMGIPVSHDLSRPSPSQEDIQGAAHNAIPRFHYNIWGLVDHHHDDHQSPYGNLNQQTPKGLSLSLTVPHQTGFDRSNIPSGDEYDHDFPGQVISQKNCSSPADLTTTSSAHRTNGVNYNNTVQSVIMGSEYLKAAQELLDEVVSVGKGKGRRDKAKIIKESIRTDHHVEELRGGGESGNKNGGVELTTAQRQEIQMKKAKLNSMLDEVEQRYKQYHHQMQILVTSFEQIAGAGSAKSYTHLALRTILKQFRDLKNTISAQINALSKSLGEEDNSGGKMEGSRLKFVDHHLRQQRTLQQLGMMQSNAWRPQRGLPERAVSVLRAWLFEHFLHPYPKDSDKHMLAKQTGITKSQVSNWFINARVRLWKPMVEAMYLEEIKNQEISPDDDNNTTKPDRESSNSKPNPGRQANNNITNTPITNNLNTLVPISPSTIIITKSPTRKTMQQNPPEKNPKKPRNNNSPISSITRPGEYHDQTINKGFENNITFIGTNLGQTRENYLSSSSSGFSSTYGISDHQQIPSSGGFQGNNIFSLTLGLPPSETYSQGGHQQEFFPHRSFEFGARIEPVESDNRVNGINQGSGSHPNVGNYEILDFQNRKPFPAQLLHDHFVA